MIKCVFMFDFCGVQIDKGTIRYLSDKYKIKSGSINGAIVRKSIVDQKFYLTERKTHSSRSVDGM